jgi:hypothetical protein
VPLLTPATAILLGLAALLCFAVIAVTSYFRLSAEAKILRQSAMSSIPGAWHRKIALHVGGLTTGALRAGSHLVKLAPEPRAALDALHGGEVGIYSLEEEPEVVDGCAFLARADQAMSARGWERVVGVSKERELVAVYSPRRGVSSCDLRCCVVVFQGRDLVVVSARGNLEPLLEIARTHINLKDGKWRSGTGVPPGVPPATLALRPVVD